MPSDPHGPARAARPTALIFALLAIASIAVVGVLPWFVAPRYVAVTAVPSDSLVTLDGGPSARGRLVVEVGRTTRARVTVRHAGYTTQVVNVRTTPSPNAGAKRVVLAPERVPLHVTAGPGDPVVSVYSGDTRVLVGVRRVSGELPSGVYRITAEATAGARAERQIALDRPTRVELLTDSAKQRALTLGMTEANGRISGLAFSADGSLLAATLFDGPPDRQLFTTPSLGLVPDATQRAIGFAGFERGKVATSVVDVATESRYAIDTTGSAVLTSPLKGRAHTFAKLPATPTMLGLADGGRLLVVGTIGGRAPDGTAIPGLIVLDARSGIVRDRIDSPTCIALAISPNDRDVAVSDSPSGRIRLLRLGR